MLFSSKAPAIPLFALRGTKYVELVGSAALCLLGGKPFLITCAHVAVRFSGARMVTFFAGRFWEVPGGRVRKTAPLPDDPLHQRDPFDLATVAIPPGWLDSAIESVIILDWSMLTRIEDVGDDCFFTFCGYPGSQNSKVSIQGGGRVRFTALNLKAEKGLPMPHGFSETTHLAAKWNPRSAFNSDGKEITPPELWGLSGGPMVMVWKNRLAWVGMGVYNDPTNEVVLGVRAEAIFYWIDELRKLGDVPQDVWETVVRMADPEGE